ncbi:MAG: phosphoheptose isomerase [Devosia sp.]|nr:phosphoheptose isomerase [Devosia sp.]
MIRFPARRVTGMAEFFDGYAAEMARAAQSVSREALERAQGAMRDCLDRDGTLFLCGNGGSAAVANHLVCDMAKGMRTDNQLRPRIQSLAGGAEILTAISNDMSYADTFSHQLEGFGRKGDLLITISSSGNSENIVRAVQWARDNGAASIALTGFSGGRSAGLADVNLHVDSQNYGVVEDLHQSLLHALAQFIRLSLMPEALIGQRNF